MADRTAVVKEASLNPSLLILAGLLTLSTPPGKGDRQITVIGELTEQGRKRCNADGTLEWIDLHHQVGFTRLTGPKIASPEALLGRPVVVTGRADPGFRLQAIHHAGPCPVAQMRSDMVWGKNGMRFRRAGQRTGLGFLKQTGIRALTELTASLKGDRIVVSFTNPTQGELRDVALRVHYEGCHGKPGHTSREQAWPTVAVGQTLTASLPAFQDQHRGPSVNPVHKATTVQVIAGDGAALFDLDVWLSKLGVSLQCPR